MQNGSCPRAIASKIGVKRREETGYKTIVAATTIKMRSHHEPKVRRRSFLRNNMSHPYSGALMLYAEVSYHILVVDAPTH